MMNRIRIGQVGVAHGHAAGKMAVFRRSPDYEVVGIVETDAQRRARAQQQDVYKHLKWMSQDELFNVPGLQAVAVETEVRDLLNVAESCIAADKHIHLDKPAGSSLPQFKRILDEAARKHLVVQMGYMYRYNPAGQVWAAIGRAQDLPLSLLRKVDVFVTAGDNLELPVWAGNMAAALGKKALVQGAVHGPTWTALCRTFNMASAASPCPG